jgi:hypothetical protein
MLKAAAALAIPVAMFGAVASTSFLVVDVRETGPDGVRIVLPVPLILAQAAASFVPESQARVDVPEIEEYLPAAEKLVAALRDVPDAELVRVEERDELVTVSKVGDVLEVRVHGSDGENVSVNVPLSAVEEILASAEGGTIDVRDAIAALRGVSRTNLVEVHDGDEHVKVWIW